jgi:hypothetical protein
MADASNTLTWDQTTPHRPALDELGGGTKENDPAFPPDPIKHPRAEEYNQFSKQFAGYGRIAPLARLHVQISGGVPTIIAAQAPGANVDIGDFTVVDNAAGDTTIWWTTGSGGTLPATTGYPEASVATDDDTTITAVYTTVSGHPAVHVRTRTAGTLTDANFVVTIN